jgi:hypothetical protein
MQVPCTCDDIADHKTYMRVAAAKWLLRLLEGAGNRRRDTNTANRLFVHAGYEVSCFSMKHRGKSPLFPVAPPRSGDILRS